MLFGAGGGYILYLSGALSRISGLGIISAEFFRWRAAVQEKEQPFRKAFMLSPSYDVVFLRDLCLREADRYRACRRIASSWCHSIFYPQIFFIICLRECCFGNLMDETTVKASEVVETTRS